MIRDFNKKDLRTHSEQLWTSQSSSQIHNCWRLNSTVGHFATTTACQFESGFFWQVNSLMALWHTSCCKWLWHVVTLFLQILWLDTSILVTAFLWLHASIPYDSIWFHTIPGQSYQNDICLSSLPVNQEDGRLWCRDCRSGRNHLQRIWRGQDGDNT